MEGFVALTFLLSWTVAAAASAKIFSKAGYSPWLCLTIFIPLVNLGVLIWFGFSHWPLERQLERCHDALLKAGIS